eukprot:CAMPEP_0117473872 /NCGR_PEP_ID=MMETSP0784-20121206/8993_1 /TAXON_ID=39447 /ORGANISM="" /LENGTH=202 /DNA_ID=CAMNT_0005268081 /DNA_START=179 /DNA_END=787 /DNA_ORIENTATION=-
MRKDVTKVMALREDVTTLARGASNSCVTLSNARTPKDVKRAPQTTEKTSNLIESSLLHHNWKAPSSPDNTAYAKDKQNADAYWNVINLAQTIGSATAPPPAICGSVPLSVLRRTRSCKLNVMELKQRFAKTNTRPDVLNRGASRFSAKPNATKPPVTHREQAYACQGVCRRFVCARLRQASTAAPASITAGSLAAPNNIAVV